MTDPFPAQHTTRTIVTETHVAPQIRYDPTYIKTIPGIIKIVCIVSIIYHTVMFVYTKHYL